MASNSKTVFIAVQSGFAARYYLQTDILETLRSASVRVVVLSPNADEQHFRDEFESVPDVVVEKLRLAEYATQQRVSVVRRFLRLVRWFSTNFRIRPNTSSEYSWILAKRNARARWKTSLDYVLLRPFVYISRRSRFLRHSLVWLEHRLPAVRLHGELFDKYRPDMLVVPSLGYLGWDAHLIREAHEHGVQVTSVVLSWDNTTTKGRAGANVDHVVAWTEAMKDELHDFHDIDRNDVFVGGVAHFDLYRRPEALIPKRELFERLGLDPGRRLVFFASRSPKAFPWGPDITVVLARAIEEGRLVNAQLLVRPHPLHYVYKDGQPLFGDLIDEYEAAARRYSHLVLNRPGVRSHHLKADMPWSDMIELGSILNSADVLVNIFSTVAIEASIFDLPAVHVSFRGETSRPEPLFTNIDIEETRVHVERMMAAGGARVARDAEQLVQLVDLYLQSPHLDAAGRRTLMDQECGPFPGRAGKTIGKHLVGLLDATTR